MFEALINHSSDLQRLQAANFQMEACGGWLIIHHIPYLNQARQLMEGTLIIQLTTSGNHTSQPHDHTAYWIGERPCDVNGNFIPSLGDNQNKMRISDQYVSDYFFSCHAEKEEYPPEGKYPTYFEKVTRYFDMIATPAINIDSEAWSRINKPVAVSSDNSPFRYMDTNSSRACISGLSSKFYGLRIAIIGLGGTGSYLLDLIAKTPVSEIHLFDADVMSTHNAFRAPGAPDLSTLSLAPKKVDYMASIYSHMHKGIKTHPLMITSQNLSDLENMDYIFLSLDMVKPKKLIASYLIEKHIPFIDSGMGIDIQQDGKLSGLIHVALGTPTHYEHLSVAMGSENSDDEMYATNIQIAELNALAANLSVIKWKKMLGFYADTNHEHLSVYGVNDNDIENEEKEV